MLGPVVESCNREPGPMDVFRFRAQLIETYASYIRSFLCIREPRLRRFVDDRLASGALWP
jgi:hypothetical protein